jgi:hypothetical protein
MVKEVEPFMMANADVMAKTGLLPSAPSWPIHQLCPPAVPAELFPSLGRVSFSVRDFLAKCSQRLQGQALKVCDLVALREPWQEVMAAVKGIFKASNEMEGMLAFDVALSSLCSSAASQECSAHIALIKDSFDIVVSFYTKALFRFLVTQSHGRVV